MCCTSNRHTGVCLRGCPRCFGIGQASSSLDNPQHARSERLFLLSPISNHEGKNTNAALGTRHHVQGSRSSLVSNGVNQGESGSLTERPVDSGSWLAVWQSSPTTVQTSCARRFCAIPREELESRPRSS